MEQGDIGAMAQMVVDDPHTATAAMQAASHTATEAGANLSLNRGLHTRGLTTSQRGFPLSRLVSQGLVEQKRDFATSSARRPSRS